MRGGGVRAVIGGRGGVTCVPAGHIGVSINNDDSAAWSKLWRGRRRSSGGDSLTNERWVEHTPACDSHSFSETATAFTAESASHKIEIVVSSAVVSSSTSISLTTESSIVEFVQVVFIVTRGVVKMAMVIASLVEVDWSLVESDTPKCLGEESR